MECEHEDLRPEERLGVLYWVCQVRGCDYARVCEGFEDD